MYLYYLFHLLSYVYIHLFVLILVYDFAAVSVKTVAITDDLFKYSAWCGCSCCCCCSHRTCSRCSLSWYSFYVCLHVYCFCKINLHSSWWMTHLLIQLLTRLMFNYVSRFFFLCTIKLSCNIYILWLNQESVYIYFR